MDGEDGVIKDGELERELADEMKNFARPTAKFSDAERWELENGDGGLELTGGDDNNERTEHRDGWRWEIGRAATAELQI